MLNLEFIPENKEFAEATNEYLYIWENFGEKIVDSIELTAQLKFKDSIIKVTVYEGISQSHPFKLRASYDLETKAATLVHELLHRLSADYLLSIPEPEDEISLGLHKQIYLILYDLWVDLFGKEVADRQVKIESSRIPLYKDAWEWALSLNKEERRKEFAKLRI